MVRSTQTTRASRNMKIDWKAIFSNLKQMLFGAVSVQKGNMQWQWPHTHQAWLKAMVRLKIEGGRLEGWSGGRSAAFQLIPVGGNVSPTRLLACHAGKRENPSARNLNSQFQYFHQ